jgi:predicted nucleic acid-binding protein
MSTAAALSLLGEQVIDTDHTFWPDDISLLDSRRFDFDRIVGPKQLTDVYLLALAVKHGGRLATFDRTIPVSAIRGGELQHLAVV